MGTIERYVANVNRNSRAPVREMTYRKFDWTSLLHFQLLDGERVRMGKVVEVVDSDDASSVFVKINEQTRNGRTLLVDTAAIGIIGDGWAMLDQPIRSARAFFHETTGEPAGMADHNEVSPGVDEQLDVAHGACPHCGSASQAS